MSDRHNIKIKFMRRHVLIGAAFVLLSAMLFEGDYVRHLMKDAVADSVGIGISVLTFAWWILAAWLGVTLIKQLSHRFFFPHDDQPKRRKIVSDLAAGLIYLIAAFGILQYSFHQPLTGMLATSGIVAVVLGLALQSTLSDLFSGIALNIERPFQAGDWITTDGGTQGQVIEINWRATRMREQSGDVSIIPNSLIAKQRVTNHSLYEKPHATSICLELAIESSYANIEAILVGAAQAAEHVLSDPPPEVTVLGIRSGGVSFCTSFFVADFATIALAQDEVFKQILVYLSNAELRLARQEMDVAMLRGSQPRA